MGKLGSTDITVSRIIMGTWQAGKQYWVDVHDAESQRAMRAALDLGINAFDTAEEYGEGHSERVLGEALEGVRQQAVIMSKVFSNHLRYDQVIESCHKSLRNLRTDYLDLYQIHWPGGSWGNEAVPVQETLHALTDLKHQGKIRAIGVSNFSLAQLEEAAAHAHLDSIQPPYNLFWRHIEAEILPWCQQRQISVLAYSPLAQGILADRFGPEPQFAEGDHRSANKLFDPQHYPRVLRALDSLRQMAQARKITLAQLALAWLIHQPQVFAIAGARTTQQVEGNAGAMAFQLTQAEWDEINAIGKVVADPFAEDPVPWTWEP